MTPTNTKRVKKSGKKSYPLVKRPTAGYVVIDPSWPGGRLMEDALDPYLDAPRKRILVMGDAGTVFQTREAANAAIRRTVAYANAKGLLWKACGYKVVRLVSNAKTKGEGV